MKAIAAALWVFLATTHLAAAQSFRRGGVEFHAMRTVKLPPDQRWSVVVVQFFHHGQIAPDGRNVLVSTLDRKPVPSRVLQLGPGDFCRLAFETVARESTYEVFYGGEAPAEGVVPPWTSRDGLLLETRHYKECNLNSLESVREAFFASKPIGADYVAGVRHSYDPFSLRMEPFMSRYSGYLHVASAGTYRLFTSSQDCSFLLIDDVPVVSAPGRHRAQRWARPGTYKEIRLSAGDHKFEYYHAATGPAATMVAAWEVAASGAKPKPAPIPPEAFRATAIGRAEAGSVTLSGGRPAPDFLIDIAGDVPLPDEDLALIGVRFVNVSPPALKLGAKPRWDFGDGQTSEDSDPVHVYLHSGTYPVTLSIKRGTRTVEMVNRVAIDRPTILRNTPQGRKPHTLDDYLPILQSYDPKALDAVALRQLVLAFQFKAETILAGLESDQQSGHNGSGASDEPKQAAAAREAKRAEALQYVAAAVAAGKVAFLDESAAQGDADLIRLARLIGPMARDDLGDSPLAGQIWQGASQTIGNAQLKAECEIRAGDVILNDLLKPEEARELLEAAAGRLPNRATGPLASRLGRVWGDYYAQTGEGDAARKRYLQSGAALADGRSLVERTAWQGAHSRSTEQFLKTGDLDRAARELRAWQNEFPAEKIAGYLNLLLARYWAAREMPEQAIAVAEAQLAVYPDSPYMDRLLLLAAQCHEKRGAPRRALATLKQLLDDYPGSPLVPLVRENVARLEAASGGNAGEGPAARGPEAGRPRPVP